MIGSTSGRNWRTRICSRSAPRSFTWFSFVTIFYTLIGVFAYVFGFVLGWEVLSGASTGILVLYLVGVLGLTGAALITGIWWFVGGEGERRLRRVLDDRFGHPLEASDDAS